MPPISSATNLIRFGVFEADLATGELRKSGVRLHVQDQPFKVLALLLQKAGEIVTRDELRRTLWPDSEFGDFDHAINIAIKKLRDVLGDSAERPRFIETLAKRGYRFVAPVTCVEPAALIAAGSQPPAISAVAQPAPEPLPAPVPRATPKRWRAIAVAVGVLVIATILLFLAVRSRPSSWALLRGQQPTVTPLTGSLGHEFRPQFSPDGKQIAFSWAGPQDNGADIYVKLLDAGAPVRITEPIPHGGHFAAVWSPDGRYFACLRVTRPPDDPALKPAEPPKDKDQQPGDKVVLPAPPDIGVYVMPAVGGPERRVATVTSFGGLSWSPDGEWLAVSDGERFAANAIYLVSTKTLERKQLTTPPAGYKGDYTPEFSRDGRYVAFARNLRNGADDVFIVPVTGGEPRRVTQEWQPIKGLTFSENGKDIIYAAGWKGGGNSFLWRVPVAGGASERIEIAGDGASDPTIAPRGHRLAFTQGVSATNIWQYEIPPQPGKYASAKVLLGSTRQQAGGDFSPDGNRIVYASNRSGNWEIWICERDGSKPVQLTNFGGPQTGTPRWSPDGKHVAFDSRPEGHSEIFVLDVDSARNVQLTHTQGDSVVPSFSRDGKWVYFASNRAGSWDIWKQAVSGGDAVQVTKSGGFNAFESVDGSTLFYSKWNKPGVFSISVRGTADEKTVVPDLLPRIWGYWAVAADGIYYLRPAKKVGSTDLYPSVAFYSFAAKRSTDIMELEKGPIPAGPGLSISPDHKYVLYKQVDNSGADIMVVEGFH